MTKSQDIPGLIARLRKALFPFVMAARNIPPEKQDKDVTRVVMDEILTQAEFDNFAKRGAPVRDRHAELILSLDGLRVKDFRELAAILPELEALTAAPKSEGAVTAVWKAVVEAQDVLADYIVPDSGISEMDCVNRLLDILDHQDLVRAMRAAPSNPLPAAREEVGVSGAANVRNVAANVRNEMARILTAIKMPTDNADKEDIISYATEIVGLRAALRRAPAAPAAQSQEVVLRKAPKIGDEVWFCSPENWSGGPLTKGRIVSLNPTVIRDVRLDADRASPQEQESGVVK